MTDTRPQLRRPEPTSPGEHDVRPAVSLRALRKVFGHGEDAVEAIGGIDLRSEERV